MRYTILAVAAVCWLACVPAAQAVNLLQNASFEDGGGSITNWTPGATGGFNQIDNTYPSATAYDGSHYAGRGCSAGSGNVTHEMRQTVSVTMGTDYLISVWVFSEGSPNRTRVRLKYLHGADPGADDLGTNLANFMINTVGWQQLSGRVTAGASQLTMILWARWDCTGGGGGVNFDYAEVVPVQAMSSVLTNPGFETGTGTGWTLTSASVHGASWFNLSSAVNSGSWGAGAAANGNSVVGLARQDVDLLENPWYPISAGDLVEFSGFFQLYSDGTNPTGRELTYVELSIVWRNSGGAIATVSGGKRLAAYETQASNFQLMQHLIVPTGATIARLRAHVVADGTTGGGWGQATVDDLEFRILNPLSVRDWSLY